MEAGLLTLGNGKCRRPLIPQNVKADAAVGVDIGVVDAGGEVDLRGLERVVGREGDAQEEDTGGVWGVGLRASTSASARWRRLGQSGARGTYGTHDSRLPVELFGSVSMVAGSSMEPV